MSTPTRKTRKTPEPSAEFIRTREFIGRFSALPTDDDLDIVTLWAMGTWTFSPACAARPATYPYLYLTGAKGSGKTHLGHDVLKYVVRNHKATALVTGPTLFRMLGNYDPESGLIINDYPTIAVDEIDATYSGSQDESLRGAFNVGYAEGAFVDRAAGKTTIQFPVYGPKCVIGIDNGHLPETITDRCIRIDIKRATTEQMSALTEGPYSFEVGDESADLQQTLSDWAKQVAPILHEYRPTRIDGLSPRQWQIARSLIQLARSCGIEQRIADAIVRVMTRRPEQTDGRVDLYQTIFDMFETLGTDRLASYAILSKLTENGVRVPAQSMKGLSSTLSVDGISPTLVSLPAGHPHIPESGQNKQRGYFKNYFDRAFLDYLFPED